MRFGIRMIIVVVVAVAALLVPGTPWRGAAVAAPTITTPDSTGDVGQHASMALDAAGNPVVSYYDATNRDLKLLHCGDPNCASGNSITSPDTVGDVGQYTSLALDGMTPVISYFDYSNFRLKILRCGNANCASGNTVTSPDLDLFGGFATSLQLDVGGRPVVSYSSETGLRILRCGNTVCTSGNTIATADAVIPESSSLELNAAGNAVVSYQAGYDLKLATCNDSACSAPSVQFMDPGADVSGIDASLKLDSAGRPVVAYRADDQVSPTETATSVRIIRCGNALCTGGNVIAELDSGTYSTSGIETNVASGISLALDGLNRPSVSYAAYTNIGFPPGNFVTVAHCDSPTCSLFKQLNLIDASAPSGEPTRTTAIVLDAASNPVVAFHEPAGMNLGVAHCDTADCGLADPSSIEVPDSSPNNHGYYSSLELSPASLLPVISYQDGTSGSLRVTTCSNPRCSAGTPVVVDDAAPGVATVGYFSSLAITTTGLPVVAHYDTVGQALRLTRCLNPLCGSASTTVLESVDFPGQYASLRLSPADLPRISHWRAGTGDLRYYRCGNAACDSGNGSATLDAADVTGSYSSMALDGENPVIAYRKDTGGDLRLLRCANAACSTNNIVTLDATNDTGYYASLRLDAAGNPVVSYKDVTTGDLKLARCANVFCTSGTSITTVDSAGNVGSHTSLALDLVGNPVISYRDTTNGDLKLVFCGDPDCSANNTFVSPDTVGDTGFYTSLEISESGDVFVSYLDATLLKLKVLRCTDMLCGTPPPGPGDGDGDGFLEVAQTLHLGPVNTNVAFDNCPGVANASQSNGDGNFIDLSPPKAFDDATTPSSDASGDACDADDDNDGRTDAAEIAGGLCGVFTTPTNPLVMDSDGDLAIDGAECAVGTNPAAPLSKPTAAQCGAATDGDGDGLPAYREVCYYGTSDSATNSDGDSCGDAREIMSVNGDQTVNAIDLSQVAQSFGPSSGPNYLANFDVTRDLTINAIDLSQVARRFGPC